MLQRTNATTNSFYQHNQDATTNINATTNECYNEQFLSIQSGCYNEHKCYNERMLQRTVFINRIMMLQRTNATTDSFYPHNQDATKNTDAIQRTRRNTIGRRSTRVSVTGWAFPLWLERQSSPLLSFVKFSYQFSSVIWLFALLAVNTFYKIILLYNFCHESAK